MNEPLDVTRPQTRVDFYLLKGTNPQKIQQFCCRLVEKVWKLGNTVFIRTEDEQQAQLLDNLMWTYNDNSFLPHARERDTQEFEIPIIIGSKIEPKQGYDLMINLANDIPDQYNHYSRIAEIINEDEIVKKQGRIKYGQYDQKNYPLNHHNISV